MRRFVVFGPAIVVLLSAIALMFVGPTLARRLTIASEVGRAQAAREILASDNLLEQLSEAVGRVASAVQPSLVHVDVDIPRSESSGGRIASGAGWVWDEFGHVVTNAHVVRGARMIRVQAADGRISPAEIVKADVYTDIAVLRLSSSEGFYPIERATNEEPRLGQRVFAFGSPFGFKFSMSEGIISGLARDPLGPDEPTGMTNYIQTDAAVNPGNSGGPLVDARARLIGMNVAIATGAGTQTLIQGQSAGISFAIPLSTIEPVVSQMVKGLDVSRGYLGIRIPGNEAPIITESGFVGTGIPIPYVDPAGPAGRAGLRTGDIVTHFNSQPVRTPATLRSAIGALFPGDRATMRVWRTDTFLDLDVVLGEFPQAVMAGQSIVPALARFGAFVREFDGRVVIAEVFPRSYAEEAGLSRGNQVVEVAGRPIASLDDFNLALMRADFLIGKEVLIRVTDEPDGPSRPVLIRLPR